MAVLALAAGFIGWLCEDRSDVDAVINAFYRSVQLFVLEFPEGDPPNPFLQFARLLAAAVTGWAVIALVAGMLRDKYGDVGLRRFSEHTVVVGCGRAGMKVVEGLRRVDGQQRLVVVDIDEETLGGIRYLSRTGVVIGDGRDEAVLRRANVHRAKRVVVAVGDWASADAITRSVPPTVPTTLTHVRDLSLCHVTRLSYLASATEAADGPRRGTGTRRDGSSTDVFNLQENAAQSLLRRYDERLCGVVDGPETVVIVGGDRIGEAVIVQACLSWLASARPIDLRLEIVGEDTSVVENVRGRWPELGPLVQNLVAIHRRPMDFAVSADLADRSLYIVDLDDEDHGLAVAATLASRKEGLDCAVVSNLHSGAEMNGAVVRDLASLGVESGVLEQDSSWLLARSLHEVYRQGDLAGTSPNSVSWADLSSEKRSDNRSAAIFMLRLLDTFGIRLIRPDRLDPAVHPQPLVRVLGTVIVERMAAAEHVRWLEAKTRHDRHTEPWEELSEEARSENIRTVDRWPRLLLRLGYSLKPTAYTEELGELLAGALRYERTGTVRAKRETGSVRWWSAAGDAMQGKHGDWVVSHGSKRWTVSPNAFTTSYEKVEGDTYRRVGSVLATQLQEPFGARSPEGQVHGRAGDWLVTNDRGDIWIVGDEKFKASYRRVPTPG